MGQPQVHRISSMEEGELGVPARNRRCVLNIPWKTPLQLWHTLILLSGFHQTPAFVKIRFELNLEWGKKQGLSGLQLVLCFRCMIKKHVFLLLPRIAMSTIMRNSWPSQWQHSRKEDTNIERLSCRKHGMCHMGCTAVSPSWWRNKCIDLYMFWDMLW